MQPILNINIVDKELFGNDAGEDEKIEILNSYYVERDDLNDFFDKKVKLNVVSARKGMGKSSLLARLNYKLKNETGYDEPIVVKVTGNTLLGLGDFKDKDQAYLENYWKQIICKKIIIEIGSSIGVALSSDAMSMVEIAELEGMKSRNLVGGLIARVKGKLPFLEVETRNSFPENLERLLENYQAKNENSTIWLLVDDIDAKYLDTIEYQTRIGSFFSAIRALAVDAINLNIRATVRTDVWANLNHLEDLDKWEQYIVEIVWTKKMLRDMLANRILSYIQRNHPESVESRYKVARDYNKIFATAFAVPIRWGDAADATIFDAIYSFSNKRPRWMGQLCRMAAEQTKKHSNNNKRITIDHIKEILNQYGKLRKNDLIKEHLHQFLELDQFIDAFRANSKQYKYSEILTMFTDNFVNQRSAANIAVIDGKKYVSEECLGAFAYKIGLISHVDNDGRVYTHFSDNPDLFRSIKNRRNEIAWSVHIAFREYLNIH
jgi:hypothetical protein